MHKTALGPYLFLAGLYAMVVTYLYAYSSLYYSGIPERVVFLQENFILVSAPVTFIICAISLLLVIAGGVVMYKADMISRTWLLVYLIVPLLFGIVAFGFIYLLTFVNK